MATLSKTTKDILTIFFVYIVSRCLWLTRFPIFNDESTYLRYGWIMTTVHNQQWYSLAHTGKQPFLYWLYGAAMHIISDPLIAGRLVTVSIGILTPLACYTLGQNIGSRKTGLIAGIMAVICPLLLFFDRMALVDSTLVAIFAWMLVVLVRFRSETALRDSIFLGCLVGVSLWIKSTGFIFALISILGIAFQTRRLMGKPVITFVTAALVVFMPLLLRPEYNRVMDMASDYAYSISDLVQVGLGHIWGNMLNTFLVYTGYVSPVVLISVLFYRYKTFSPRQGILLMSWIISTSIILMFGKSVHGRYLLFTILPLLVLTAEYISKKNWLIFLTFAPMVGLSTLLLVNPPAFFHVFPAWKVYAGESYQYIDGWPSGYGVKEALRAIDEDRSGQSAIIAVRWDTGNPEDAIFVYTTRSKNLSAHYMDARLPEETKDVLAASAKYPVYFVTRKGQYGGFEQYLTPMAQFHKPWGSETVEVFKVDL